MKINKKKLTSNIYNRINSTIPKKKIHDTITVICEYMLEQITKNKVFSVKNFGTFSPYMHKAHIGFNVAKGELQRVKSFLNVKFHPHVSFLKMLKARRNKHRNSDVELR